MFLRIYTLYSLYYIVHRSYTRDSTCLTTIVEDSNTVNKPIYILYIYIYMCVCVCVCVCVCDQYLFPESLLLTWVHFHVSFSKSLSGSKIQDFVPAVCILKLSFEKAKLGRWFSVSTAKSDMIQCKISFILPQPKMSAANTWDITKNSVVSYAFFLFSYALPYFHCSYKEMFKTCRLNLYYICLIFTKLRS
jgi:hypothetical protein